MGDFSVSISVVTYNSAAHIGALLDSFARHVQGVPYHIYVVDNASTDGTEQIVESKADPNVTLVRSGRNLGFGGGHNLVLNRIDSRYHLCVNPDVIIGSDVVADMAHYMDAHEDIGILSPKVLGSDGNVQALPKKNPRLIYLIARRVSLRFLEKYRREYEMSYSDGQSHDIEFCSGCFMFMRTALFRQLGGFDERFFLYFEDADLTRRIRSLARAAYNPAFTIVHRWERAGSRKLKYFLIQVASMVKYMRKWRRSDTV